jgi:alanyl-tRNA synthetase
VSIGVPVAELLSDPGSAKWRQYSIEFCGGTHLGNSLEVEALVITTEEAVSKGVRRIVALTGAAAAAAQKEAQELEQEWHRLDSLPEPQLPMAINAVQKQLGSETLPLRVKRQAQQRIAQLQATNPGKNLKKSTRHSLMFVVSRQNCRPRQKCAPAGELWSRQWKALPMNTFGRSSTRFASARTAMA